MATYRHMRANIGCNQSAVQFGPCWVCTSLVVHHANECIFASVSVYFVQGDVCADLLSGTTMEMALCVPGEEVCFRLCS